ncbi:hypothetical protein C2E23DRAFT_785223 [Lenzites betulinus]|nr:hypothetical protein C2E23DRAFT_785223 [Lenzites betulinus]
MVRHNSPFVQRASPAAPKTVKHARFATRPPQHQKPHFLAKPSVPRSPGLRARLASANTNRFLQGRSQLSTIREEEEEEGVDEHRIEDSRDRRRQTHSLPHDDARAAMPRRQGHDVDADMSNWDDESTLVAMLQDGSPEMDEEDQMLELVQKLKAPMAAQGVELKQYLADTVLPAYSRIKDVHGVLEDKVDLEFGAGLLTFDEVCKKVERIALKDEDEIRTAHTQSQRNVAKTVDELEQAYERRKELWNTLRQELDQCASRANAALEALPGDLEQTIALLEKKSKAVEKDTASTSNQKILRGLLEKL